MINYFVREQAKINYLNPYRTSYSIEYEIDIKAYEIPGNRLEIISSFAPKNLYGDISYKLFDLADVLAPNVYGFTIRIPSIEQTEGPFELEMLPVGDTTVTILQLSEGIDFNNVELETSDIHFTYTDQSIVRFNSRINEIHEYLASHELIEFSLEKALKIDLEEKTDNLVTHLQIYELERFQNFHQNQLANSMLLIPAAYQNEYQSGTEELSKHLRRLRAILDNRIEMDNYSFDDETYSNAANKLIGLQLDYLDGMKKTNHFHEPVYQKVASFFNKSEDWLEMISSVAQTFRDIDIELFRKQFGVQLLQSYMELAEQYFETDKYTEALLMLSSADVICRSNPEIDCGLKVFHNLSKAKFGIYDSYLQIAESAMAVQNLNLARHYLNLALDYQAKNSGVIILPAAVTKLFEQLAWLFFESGRNAVREKKWETAYAHLAASKEIYQMLKLSDFDDAIENELSKIEN